MLNHLYGTVAARRRRWYEQRPDVRRRLAQPVISVGALTVGGSGKTPVTAHVVEVLVSMGECPALLSRGYRRQQPVDGVVVVRDADTIRSDVAHAGDEPFMLAGMLPDTSVLVSEDRYLAGRLAETRLGATVHVLDDGFQHLSLDRAVDLVVVGEGDTADPRTLPGGRLREPLDTVRRTDALVVETRDPAAARQLAARFDLGTAFSFFRELQSPREAESHRDVLIAQTTKVLAVAGIARPLSFFEALQQNGYTVAATLKFPDHHPYSPGDLANIRRLADVHGVEYVVTTEKDLVRLLPHAPFDVPLVWIPLKVSVEPADDFLAWLRNRLRQAREG